ncbi:MAG: hypothetical protein QW806_06015 [Nitrososphaerota archaeon]
MLSRFCLECKNFEDRMEIDGNVVCARGHDPGINCPDFKDKFEDIRNVASKTRFCIECKNFEDRRELDGNVVCAKGHNPGISCPDFQDRTTDIFYNYIYWSYICSIGKSEGIKDYFEKKFSKKLSIQELAYAILIEYFNIELDYSNFCRCWSNVRRIYKKKMPLISEILDVALERFNLYGERIDLKKVFLDMVYSIKKPEEIIKEISIGIYKK